MDSIIMYHGCIFADVESSLVEFKVHWCIIFTMQLRGDAGAATAIEESCQRGSSRELEIAVNWKVAVHLPIGV